MQNVLRRIFPFAIVTIVLLLATMAIAVHTPSVSISPQQSMIGTDAEFKLLVKNQDGSGITSVQLVLPETGDGNPYYLIKEIGYPADWTFEAIERVGASYPYKIIWSTNSAGIAEDKSLEFSFVAKVPSASGEFTWTWKTTDAAGGVVSDKFTTKTILAPLSVFKLTLPQSVKAGEYFKVTINALDKDGNVKTDYTGTVTFTSSDKLAILPADYTFKSTDRGTKEFTLKFKTAGNQTVTVTDGTISLTSGSISVGPSDVITIIISPDNSKVALGNAVNFKVMAEDVFANVFDVTAKTKISIDPEAKGTWVGNFYKAEVEGVWTVVADYTSGSTNLVGGTTLTVTKAEEKPQEVKPEENVTQEVLVGKMSIVLPNEITVEEGKNVTLNLTVKNTGTLNLTDVFIAVSGVPREWIRISPLLADISSGKSYNYLLTVSVPQNTTGKKTITFSISAIQNVTASKNMTLTIGKPASGITGLIVAIFSRPLYIGILIVIIIVIVLIIWALWPKKSKKKSEE